MNEPLQGMSPHRRPFVRGQPNPVPDENEGRTSIVWDTGDGSDGVVALVVQENGRNQLLGMTAGSTGACEIDWIGPDRRYRFGLYRRRDWEARDAREPRPIAETVVSRRKRRDTEMLADVAFVGLILGWVGAAVLATVVVVAFARSRRRVDRSVRG